MRYPTFSEVLYIHQNVITQTGGSSGLRDLAGLESAIAQPRLTFDGVELYPGLIEKAAALCFSLCGNHPFLDGNKRVGHAAMEIFLVLNGYEIHDSVDSQERIMLSVAAGEATRKSLEAWLRAHIRPLRSDAT